MRSFCALLLVLFTLLSSGRTAETDLPDGLYAELTTARGTITLQLDYQRAPLTVTSFVGLAEGTLGPSPGKPFFDGLKFHRVVPQFVVQGGDPLGTGEGDPGYNFPDEFSPALHHDTAGVLSMANDGPDTNGSQFFITLREVNRLNYLHSVFGRVVSGLELLPAIKQDDVITRVHIRRRGADAITFRADQAAFEALVKKTTAYAGDALPGAKAHFNDPDHLLPSEPPRAKTFNFKLNNFERATGVKIYARLFAKFSPETPGQRPGSYTGGLARELSVATDAVVVAYFADIDAWGIWICDDLVNQFMGRPGTVKEFMQDGVFHQAKQDFFSQAKQQAALYLADAEKAAPAGKPLTPQQKFKHQVDAVLDGLISKFEPRPAPPQEDRKAKL